MSELISGFTRFWEGSLQWARTHYFDFIAGWASIIGLFVSFITLLRVGSIRASHRAKDLLPVQEKSFELIKNQLESKPKITESHQRDIDYFLRRLRTYNVSRWGWRHRRIKALMKNLESDLTNGTSPEAVLRSRFITRKLPPKMELSAVPGILTPGRSIARKLHHGGAIGYRRTVDRNRNPFAETPA